MDPQSISVQARVDLGMVITQLSWDKDMRHEKIPDGKIAVLSINGSMMDNCGDPIILRSGDVASYNFAIPSFSRLRRKAVSQRLIKFAEEPGNATLSIRSPLVGISEDTDDRPVIELQIALKLVNPIALLGQCPEWANPDGSIVLEKQLRQLLIDTATTFVEPVSPNLISLSSYFAANDLSSIQSRFRNTLQNAVVDWGLMVVDTVPPNRQFSAGLGEVIYQLKELASAFQLRIEQDREDTMRALDLNSSDLDEFDALGPVVGLMSIVNREPSTALRVIDLLEPMSSSGVAIARIRRILTLPATETALTRQVIMAVLKQQVLLLGLFDTSTNLGSKLTPSIVAALSSYYVNQ